MAQILQFKRTPSPSLQILAERAEAIGPWRIVWRGSECETAIQISNHEEIRVRENFPLISPDNKQSLERLMLLGCINAAEQELFSRGQIFWEAEA